MFVLWRTRCNHDAALLIPTALPVHTMCIVRPRRVRLSPRTNRFLADGRGNSVRHFAKSGILPLSELRIFGLLMASETTIPGAFVSRAPSGTHDFFLTCSDGRAGVIIDSGKRPSEIYCILSTDAARARARATDTHTYLACFMSCVTKRSYPSRNLARHGRTLRQDCTAH